MIALLALQLSTGQPFACTVTRVHDGDGPLWCAEGPKVRVAGIQAPDYVNAEPCRRRKPGYVCSDAQARASQRIVARMVLGQRLRCVALEPSSSRMVATCRLGDGRDLACAIARSGAAAWWPAYVRRYRLGACRVGEGG